MHRVPYHLYREYGRQARFDREMDKLYRTPDRDGRGERPIELKPLTFDERSANELRPSTFDDMVGQDRLRKLLSRIVMNCKTTGRPLDHMLLAGQSGTGKTTLAQVTAHELGATVYQTKAPVTHAVLEAAQRQLRDGDVLIVDEIHQQVVGDRRGVTQAADPEDFYHVMEDRRLPVDGGMIDFPAITLFGCTTDEGLLPEAFLARFPLKLTLDPYTSTDMAVLAVANADQLGVQMTVDAAAMFGLAARRNPRQVNTYMRNAIALGHDLIDVPQAREVIVELNDNDLDGLTPDMKGMLRCLLRSRRQNAKGDWVYQASVNTIATALGHSRDTKAVSLFVEPYLISEGYVIVGHGGRQLTDAGVRRAQAL